MSQPLSQNQFLRALGLGAVLWLFAALLLKVLGPMGIYEGFNRVWLFLAIIPGTAPFVVLFRRVVGLETEQITLGFSIGTGMAIVLDGFALSWIPWLYGGADYVAGAGATILWGAGVGIFLAWAMERRERARA